MAFTPSFCKILNYTRQMIFYNQYSLNANADYGIIKWYNNNFSVGVK